MEAQLGLFQVSMEELIKLGKSAHIRKPTPHPIFWDGLKSRSKSSGTIPIMNDSRKDSEATQTSLDIPPRESAEIADISSSTELLIKT